MKFIKLNILLALIFLPTQVFANQKDSIEWVLDSLDAIIDNKSAFHAQKEQDMTALKMRLNSASDEYEKLEIYGQLFNGYLHYQADSSLHYID